MINRALRYCTRLFCTWHCVGVMVVTLNPNSTFYNHIIWFYLLENRFGERKVKIECSKESLEMDDIKKYSFYRSRIIPWLLGRTDAEVPSFRTATDGKADFIKALKGRSQNIEVVIE